MRFPALLMLSAATLTACGGSNDSTGPGDTYSGTYTLHTANGQSLPFLYDQVETTQIEVVSDTLVITDISSRRSRLGMRCLEGRWIVESVLTRGDADAGARARSRLGVCLVGGFPVFDQLLEARVLA
jgi:hypothetical protein